MGKIHIFGEVGVAFSFILLAWIFLNQSACAPSSQFVKTAETENQPTPVSSTQFLDSLYVYEQKIDSNVLRRLNCMIEENAKSHADPKREYSEKGFPVDEHARVKIILHLKNEYWVPQPKPIYKTIKRLGGEVVAMPNVTKVYCWLPYEVIKRVACEEKVIRIESPAKSGGPRPLPRK